MLETSKAAHDGRNVLEALQEQQHHSSSASRRARPPNLDLSVGNENKIPLRAQTEKLHRRRSRLALGGLFGRNKQDDSAGPVEAKKEAPKTDATAASGAGGIRSSLAGISGWPYGLHGQRSDSALTTSVPVPTPTLTPMPTPAPTSAPISAPTSAPTGLRRKKSTGAVKTQPPRPSRSPLSTWTPPPLFKAYPQAIKHARLAASTLPVETFLKAQSHKSGVASPVGGPSQAAVNLETIEEAASEKPDLFRKRHRRNTSASSLRVDWTTKIYVLVTSGYILQYAGEGSFDRLPEKILHLGKDSAAFASDLIPGRHWVLQVSSVAEPDGSSPLHTSFFSRFAFRGSDRKNAATILLVFENADDMDSWIATIRREIEALGGKRHLSETGKPKADDADPQLRGQTSQRTLVVRDPDRFSRSSAQDLAWESAAPSTGAHVQFENHDIELAREQSFDETSTASGVSHDGRQLDGLRDSANRLSFISSGQRTVVTSAGSSPACSPTRDSFASLPEDLPLCELPPSDSTQHRVLPRPNASAILDRRQSMQATNHILEMRAATGPPRPHSIYTSSWHSDSVAAPNSASKQTTIPNFSVPHSVGKRFSLVRSPETDHAPPPPVHQPAPPLRPHRRPPPAALSINPRPLSLVEDRPSPSSASPNSFDRSVGHSGEVTPDTPSIFSSLEPDSPGPRSPFHSHSPIGRPIKPPPSQSWVQVMKSKTYPRKHASMTTIRPSYRDTETAPGMDSDTPTFVPAASSPISPMSPTSACRFPADVSHTGSAMDTYMGSRSRKSLYSVQPITEKQANATSHMSHIYSQDPLVDLDFAAGSNNPQELPMRSFSPSPPRLGPVAPRSTVSSQHLRIDTLPRNVQNRRSMSYLVEGPPPAPPPTCALPPIPHKPC